MVVVVISCFQLGGGHLVHTCPLATRGRHHKDATHSQPCLARLTPCLQVLQECHAAVGIYQGELLQEVAYILRTVRSSGPAAARTRQVAMDVLRHFGSAGGDAYRLARAQQGPVAAGYPSPYAVAAPGTAAVGQTAQDPAAVAAERESLLDEIKRMVEQAAASSEILNELTLNKQEVRARLVAVWGAVVANPAGVCDVVGWLPRHPSRVVT